MQGTLEEGMVAVHFFQIYNKQKGTGKIFIYNPPILDNKQLFQT